MKTVEKIINPFRRAGEQSPGKIYDEKLKVRARREWRGVKDTFYDYTRWLYLLSVLGRFIIVPRNVKGFFRYRWMMSYLFVPHGMDPRPSPTASAVTGAWATIRLIPTSASSPTKTPWSPS